MLDSNSYTGEHFVPVVGVQLVEPDSPCVVTSVFLVGWPFILYDSTVRDRILGKAHLSVSVFILSLSFNS